MQESNLTIGEVAAQAGIRTSAIRYYEAQGVLPEPERVSGQRRYSKETVEKLALIGVAQQAGFTLPEIRDLLQGSENGEASTQLRVLAERKLPEVRALIARAEAMEKWLETASTCECSALDTCALFDESLPGAEPAAAGQNPKLEVVRRHRSVAGRT